MITRNPRLIDSQLTGRKQVSLFPYFLSCVLGMYVQNISVDMYNNILLLYILD